jgi:hypothetical protein
VVVREPAQVIPLGTHLWPALHALEVTRLTDENAAVERSYDPYTSYDLVEFVGVLEGLAEALQRARQAIPPPAAMATALPAWQLLASTLGGPLCQGRMAVRGQRAGLAAQVETRWSASAEPLGTRLVVTRAASTGAAPGAPPALSWEAHTPEPEAMARLGGRAASLVRELHTAGSVSLEGQTVAAEVPAPAFEVAPLLDHLDRMVQLCHLLGPRSGPYR